MRIFLTGATGFLGSYVARELITHGHTVAALLRHPEAAWRISDLKERLRIVAGSLDNIEALSVPLKDFAPQAIVHLGWQGVGNSDRNEPRQARNVPSALELLSMGADVGAKIFVGAGSQAEYGPYQRGIREDDETRPTTLYGLSKLAAFQLCHRLAIERDVRFVWHRIFSTFGPKDNPGWLIPSLIAALLEGRSMPLTRCEQLWSYLHAVDAASAFRLAVEQREMHGVFNLGHPDAVPLRSIVGMVKDIVGGDGRLGFGEVAYRPDQVMLLKPDMTRLRAYGWSAGVDLAAGLKETVEWFRVNSTRSH